MASIDDFLLMVRRLLADDEDVKRNLFGVDPGSFERNKKGRIRHMPWQALAGYHVNAT